MERARQTFPLTEDASGTKLFQVVAEAPAKPRPVEELVWARQAVGGMVARDGFGRDYKLPKCSLTVILRK